MKNKILITMLFVVGLLTAEVPTVKEIYNSIKSVQERDTPANLSMVVNSILIKKQLNNIPSDHINKDSGGKNKSPFVNLFFKKGQKFKFKIQNVSSFYTGMFAPYEDVLSRSGLFFAVGYYNDYSKFIKQYQLFWLSGGETIKIKIVEKDALPGDYAIFYFNKDWVLQKSDYFENKINIATATLTYKTIDKYTIPSKITIEVHDKKGIDTVSFKFSSFDFKTLATSIFAAE